MLGKLMKYEWKGLKKPLLILLLVLTGITVLTGILILTINPKYDEVTFGLSVVFTLLSVFLYYFGIIACSMGTMLVIAIRFYKTCYTDEGYLTHTLPVSPKQLVAAKTLTSVLCYLLMWLFIGLTAVLLGSIFLTHMINLGELDLSEFSADILAEIGAGFKSSFGVSFGGYLGYIVFSSIVSAVCSIITTLGCVSLGQLYTKHRVLGAIIAYFAVEAILQFVAYLSTIPMYGKIFSAEYTGETIPMFHMISPSLIITLAISVLLAVVMYFVNLHMMTKKLNLE